MTHSQPIMNVAVDDLSLIHISLGISTACYGETYPAPIGPSQSDFGGVGLLQTPTARMAREGELSLNYRDNDQYRYYSASVQLFPWLETTLRYTDAVSYTHLQSLRWKKRRKKAVARRPTVSAVSYTHLDVYKRQVVGKCIMHIVEINWRAEMFILRSGEEIQATICRQQGRGESHQSFITVSYTHLDVYKRQIPW